MPFGRLLMAFIYVSSHFVEYLIVWGGYGCPIQFLPPELAFSPFRLKLIFSRNITDILFFSTIRTRKIFKIFKFSSKAIYSIPLPDHLFTIWCTVRPVKNHFLLQGYNSSLVNILKPILSTSIHHTDEALSIKINMPRLFKLHLTESPLVLWNKPLRILITAITQVKQWWTVMFLILIKMQ